jgi:hypothetical protein
MTDDTKLYALETLGNIKTELVYLAEQTQARRAELYKYLSLDKEYARDIHSALQNALNEITNRVNEARLCLLELGEPAAAITAGKLASSLNTFNPLTRDYTPFRKAVTAFAESLPSRKTVSAAVIGRMMGYVRMGYYPTDETNLEHILRGISFPDGVVTNLLDPCCGEGRALKKLAVGNNCMTYGAELDEARAEKAQVELHRVAFGDYFRSHMSRDAFHLLFLNPPYLAVSSEHGKTRDEKRFLAHSYTHLMYGGLLVYVIPYYRLTADICRLLCDNFERLEVYRFEGTAFKRFGQICVFGKRIQKTNGSERAAVLAELAYSPERIPPLSGLKTESFTLPAEAKDVPVFRGAVFNERELARQLKASGSLNAMLTKASTDTDVRRPPLPFTFAQLGLIGGSGLINGLIECDEPHIVKGRIVKEVRSEAEENYSKSGKLLSTELRETITNKMIFNVLTPEGFISLA